MPTSMHVSQLPPFTEHPHNVRATNACEPHSRVLYAFSSISSTQLGLSLTVVCQSISTSISPSPAHVITCALFLPQGRHSDTHLDSVYTVRATHLTRTASCLSAQPAYRSLYSRDPRNRPSNYSDQPPHHSATTHAANLQLHPKQDSKEANPK
jgi:hypothetical protein